MANTKKFAVKNGLQTQNVEFLSPNEANTINVSMLDTDTLSFSGNSGQLFSITDSLTGTIFAVNDISGVPSIEVDDTGTIRLAETFGNVLIGTSTDNGVDKLQVNGSIVGSGLSTAPKTLTVTTATTNIDVSLADHWHITLQANTTFTLSNVAKKIGSSGSIVLFQDATGGRTFTKSAEMKTPLGGAAIAQVTTPNSVSLLTYYIVSASFVIVNYIGNFA